MSRFSSAALVCPFLALVVVQAVPQGRIVGGEDAMEGQFPYQISLRENGRHICGGSIISPKYILTAAHCVTNSGEPTDPSSITILAGTNNLLSGGVVHEVASVRVHEGYSGLKNDIAILELAEPLTYSRNIQPVALASAETPVDVPVTISGWGRLRTNGELPTHLQCNALYSKGNCFGPNWLICLGHAENNGACNGDSGGPAVYNEELVGVAGFVVNGCGSDSPDGYAYVFHHVDWIVKHSNVL